MLVLRLYFPSSKKDIRLLNNLKHFFFPFRAKDSVKHFHVEYTGYSFKFGFNEFSSLKDFVKHFANQPLIGSETGKQWTGSWLRVSGWGGQGGFHQVAVTSVELCAYDTQLDMFRNNCLSSYSAICYTNKLYMHILELPLGETKRVVFLDYVI